MRPVFNSKPGSSRGKSWIIEKDQQVPGICLKSRTNCLRGTLNISLSELHLVYDNSNIMKLMNSLVTSLGD